MCDCEGTRFSFVTEFAGHTAFIENSLAATTHDVLAYCNSQLIDIQFLLPNAKNDPKEATEI